MTPPAQPSAEEAVARIRVATAAQLASTRAERATATHTQRVLTAAYIEALADTSERLLAEFAAARHTAAAAQRERLGQLAEERRRDIAALLADMSRGRAAASTTAAAERRAARDALRSTTAEQLAALAQARTVRAVAPPASIAPPTPVAAVAARMNHAGLVAYAQQVRVSVARELEAAPNGLPRERRPILAAYIENLAGSVELMLRDLDALRPNMGPEQRAEAAAQLDGVGRNVSGLLRELQTAPGEAAAQLARATSRIAEELDLAYLGVSDGPAAKAARPHPAPSDDIRDDLTRIKGIGPGTQARLNQAGIVTFIQVALSTPVELRRILGGSTSRLANVDDWIAQARALASIA